MSLIKPVIQGSERIVFLDTVMEREGKYGPYLMWTFTDANNTRYIGFTENTIVTGNKLWVWLQSLGYETKAEDSFDFNTLGKLKCKIFIRSRDNVVVHATLENIINQPKVETKEVVKEEPKDCKVKEETEDICEDGLETPEEQPKQAEEKSNISKQTEELFS